jgi:transmembrane sensor
MRAEITRRSPSHQSGEAPVRRTRGETPGRRAQTPLFHKPVEVSGLPSIWPRAIGGRAARPLSAIAAIVVVALGVSLLVVRSVSHHAVLPMPGREYATAAGQRLSVTLMDGTRLTLAPASRVQVAADYGRPAGAREVALEGEAYFAVAHDAVHPFAVRAHGAVARDIGTAFDVRAYPEDVGARIAVTEGAVAVSTAQLHAGDVATVTNSELIVEHQADVAAMISWTAGRLTFENTGMGDVVRELGRWYDVELRIATPALEAQHITATYTNQPIDAVMQLIAHALGATVERHGRTMVLR